MSDAIDELIREIAARHGVAVSRDDPVMMLHTLNEMLLKETEKAQQGMLDGFREELEALSFQWGEDAKAKAERILNASLSASKEAIASLLDESARAVVASIKAEVDTALAGVDRRLDDSKRLAWICLSGGAFVLLASAVTLWASAH